MPTPKSARKKRPQSNRRPKLIAPGFQPGEKLLLHYPLCLPGDDRTNEDLYLRSYLLLDEWSLEVGERKFEEEKRDARRKLRGQSRGLKLFSEVLNSGGQKELPKTLADWGKETGLSEAEAREFLEDLSKRASKTESDNPGESSKVRRKEERRYFERKQRYLNYSQANRKAVQDLFESAAEHGDADAAEQLHKIVQFGLQFLEILRHKRPDLLRPIARNCELWPSFLSIDPDQNQRRLREIAGLEFAKGTFLGSLRGEHAFVETTSARAYALALLETIWNNRVLSALIPERLDALNAKLDEYMPAFERLPRWLAPILRLAPLTKASVREWIAASRDVLRTEFPKFHERPEWKNVRRQFEEKDVGRVQSKILYQIGSAIRTLVKESSIQADTKK